MTTLSAAAVAEVADFLRQCGEETAGPLTVRPITAGRSNVTLALDDGARRWVLRMPPAAGRTPSAHDVGREFRVTRALASTDVPVPPPVGFCEESPTLGTSFAVWEFVEGQTVQRRGDLDRLTDEQIALATAGLVDTLACLHRVDPAAVGLAGFGRAGGYAERQLRRWTSQWKVVGLPALDALATEVATRLSARLPRQRASCVVHGDYRLDNTLLTLGAVPGVAAVVDWELATLGDPVADVAMMCAYRAPAFDLVIGYPTAWASPRVPSPEALATAYESAAELTLTDWEAHLALANFKIAVIAAGIHHRSLAARHAEAASAGDAVGPYLEAALLHQASQ